MKQAILIAVTTLGFSAFAADAKKCEQAVGNVYSVMFKAKANDPALQDKKKKEAASCAQTYSDARADCLIKVASTKDIGACSKL